MALSSLARGFCRPFIFELFLLFTLRVASANTNQIPNLHHNQVCIVPATNNGSDDAPAILSAFQRCGHSGHIIFQNTTYNIQQVMNTTGLSGYQIDMNSGAQTNLVPDSW
ncbi:glycoside hydrolase family 28 protein [Cenococcum geophilum 1.58]|uniref:glycoside hydrolase family 28 protein n=1 Tax=Cenococcum geophilum 1.58 TaxID=794803 RepID=UPI00358F3B81|nr:glycoside hydrolase family 28 protein [Cenococcum geophilum 1.58]